MLTDYWAYHYDNNPKAAETEIVDEGFDLNAELARINAEAESMNTPDDWETIA